MLLVVDEGDNAPLPMTKARLLLPSYRLRFYHAGNAPLRLVYGRTDLQPPQYDLALLAPQVMGAQAAEIGAAAVSTAGTPAAAVVRVAQSVLDRADRGSARPAGPHRQVDSGAGGSGGGVTFQVQGSGVQIEQQRLRPERGAQSPRESEWGWGPTSIDKCRQNAADHHGGPNEFSMFFSIPVP